ncbi:MAG: aminotransferase class III-fold pyridoxal phosphate-dependent enzyme [Candidatus Micrarchaeota archaeon]
MIRIRTKIPGPKSRGILRRLKERNGGWSISYPLVFSGKGKGAYCEDIDGNTFLDFASQVASNPLGYNHPELVEVVRSYSGRHPIKYAGQDFAVEEHLRMLDTLASISPRHLDTAFLINSGAEAVENAIKICMRKRPGSKLGISMKQGWHGRTLGALSFTNTKKVHKKGYMRLPALRLPYDERAGEELERILRAEASAEEIAFVLIEHVQGEGGYNVAPEGMVREIRKITMEHGIPYVSDEVQSGMGRTGRWWAFEHYSITPDVFSAAKALQVGAVVSSKKMFPDEPGALSSTWGGGHALDLALGARTIEIIKQEKLLSSNRRIGEYALKALQELPGALNPRGLGLMLAFDLTDTETRDDVVAECAKRGLLVLGCGPRGIRLIPPYVVSREDVDAAYSVLADAISSCSRKGFRHTGPICDFIHCGHHIT